MRPVLQELLDLLQLERLEDDLGGPIWKLRRVYHAVGQLAAVRVLIPEDFSALPPLGCPVLDAPPDRRIDVMALDPVAIIDHLGHRVREHLVFTVCDV